MRPATERLHEHARLWNVTVADIRRTESSLIAFGVRATRNVVLKIVKDPREEWRSGEVLTAFDGNGLVRALEHSDGAVLLERVQPGHNLLDLSMGGGDEEATRIIAGIIQQMSSVRPSWAGALHVETLAGGYQKHAHSCDGLMPVGMVERAESLFRSLCATQREPRLLHGDLHHYNVLFDAERGWVAIDPWGVWGEIEYEVGASLRNPIDAPSLMASADTMLARIRVFEQRLKLNTTRAVQWAYASTVLAALWPTLEDGVDMRTACIAAATTMLSLLNEPLP